MGKALGSNPGTGGKESRVCVENSNNGRESNSAWLTIREYWLREAELQASLR